MGNTPVSAYKTPCTFSMTDVKGNETTFAGVSGADTALMMFGTTLVMLQTPAMGIAQAGMIRRKNSLSMMMQCMAGMAVGSLMWWFVGFSISFAPDLNGKGFIGDPWPFLFFHDVPRGPDADGCLANSNNLPPSIFASFQMMFALMVPVIVTGAWAEKMTMKAFFIFVTIWPVLCYYPETHWLWGPDGWLLDLGAIDFAGGMNIHTSAGWAGLVVSKMLAPRRNLEKLRMSHHNIPLLVIGGTIVWAGWYSFNGCSSLAANTQAAHALLNTHLSACTSGLTWVFLTYRRDRCFHVTDMMNGAFAGLAGVTPGSGWIPDWAAVCTGILVGIASWWSCGFMKDRMGVDDTLDCFSLQATPGMLGSVLVGLWQGGSEYGRTSADELGIFYGGNGRLLGVQFIGVLSCAAWTSVMTWITMRIIDATVGMNISVEMEDEGLDKTQIGEVGYDVIGNSDGLVDDAEQMTQELIEACARGNLGLAKKLVKAGVNPAKGDYDKRTPLHLAAASGHMHIVQWLHNDCKQRIETDARDNFGGTPTQDAMENGHRDIVAFLTSQGGTVDKTRYIGMLCDAAYSGDGAAISSLITQERVDVNAQDYDQRTALHVAVCENNHAAVKVLVANSADASLADRWGATAIDNAKALGRSSLVKYLTGDTPVTQEDIKDITSRRRDENEANVVAVMDTATKEITAAASTGNVQQVKTLLKRGTSCSVGDYDNRTPLHLAAAGGHLGVVKLLAKQRGCSINVVDRFGATPLADAVKHKHTKVAEWLQAHGATTVDQRYGYVLCLAGSKGDVKQLGVFVDSGVNMSTADYDGRTALHLAACNGHAEAVDFLIANSDSINTIDRNRSTALDDAKDAGIKAAIAKAGGKPGSTFTDSVTDELVVASGAGGASVV
jgi:Amt family ammonium transporter